MGWDMFLHAYRLQEHRADKICLQWERQMPSPVNDWMLAWAIEEGSDAALSRAKSFEGHLTNKDAWPEPYKTAASRRDIWRMRHDHSDAICDTCKWFYDGPCSSSAFVVETKNVHHSFGCSGDLMMSDWFVKNLWLGDEPTVERSDSLGYWYDVYDYYDDDDDGPVPMFCETQKSQNVQVWSSANIRDARRRLRDMGLPSKQCDVDALDETHEVLDWADRHLAGGAEIVSVHDF